MKNNNLIGISGKINSGKDTVARIIQYYTWLKKHELDEDKLNERQTCEYYLINEFIEGWGEIHNVQSEFTKTPYTVKKMADKLKDIICILIGCTREQLEDRDFKNSYLPEEWNEYRINDPNQNNLTIAVVHSKSACEMYEGYNIQEVRMSVRCLLQTLGTECGRNIIHPNIWINSLFADYKGANEIAFILKKRRGGHTLFAELPKWIITDLRFLNEIEAVKERGGVTIRVERGEPKLIPDSQFYYTPEMRKDAQIRYNNGESVKMVENPIKSIPEHESETGLDLYPNFDYTIDNNGTLEDLIRAVKQILIIEKVI